MVALFILSFSILGFSGLILTSIQVNQTNDLRNGAVRLTGEVVEDLLADRMENLPDGGWIEEQRNLNIKGVQVPYTVRYNVDDVSANLKRIEVVIGYIYKGQAFTNSSVIFKHKAL